MWLKKYCLVLFSAGEKNYNFGQQRLRLEFTDFYNTDCWLGVRNCSGWRRMLKMKKCPGAASWSRIDHSESVPSAAPEDAQLVTHEENRFLMWRVVTHPGQNVEAILQPGTFLHRLLQTSRIRILGGFQGLDLCRNSLDPKLLKNKTIMYLKIKTEKDSKTSKFNIQFLNYS